MKVWSANPGDLEGAFVSTEDCEFIFGPMPWEEAEAAADYLNKLEEDAWKYRDLNG